MEDIVYYSDTKKGSAADISNYRSIVIQSVIAKLFDRIFTGKLTEVFKKIIPNFQHGFMKNRNTTTNLLEITQQLHNSISNARIDVIYVDFAKAFDKLDQKIGALFNTLPPVSHDYEFYHAATIFAKN